MSGRPSRAEGKHVLSAVMSGAHRSDARSGSAAPAAPTADVTTRFAAFYRTALPPVYSYLVNRCRPQDVAEDLVQEVFTAALLSLRDGGSVTTGWAMRVARNKLVDHIRRESVRSRPRGVPKDEALTLWGGSPASDAALEVLDGLAGDRRAVLILRHMDGLSVPEVAEVIGRSVHATESLLARAKAEFKSRYTELSHE